VEHGGLTLTITALGLALGISTGATDSVKPATTAEYMQRSTTLVEPVGSVT
jgi:hypothetical protein